MTPASATESKISIHIVEAEEEIESTYDVMQQLRPNLVRGQYVLMIRYLMKKEGFVLAALREQELVRAVAGFRIITMLYRGRILYVDDLVTDGASRSKGFGAMMLNWLKNEAEKRQCSEIQLISRTFRIDAHRFYESHGFGSECRHFSFPIAQASRS
jgi:GNAT superfamily N-acetyltransferase